MDTAWVSSMTDVMDQEDAIYEGFLKLSKTKTDVIVQGKVSELEGITKLEQSMVLRLAHLEDVREELMRTAAGQLSIPVTDMTITSMLERIPEELAEQLSASRERLRGTVGELTRSNSLNTRLIRSALDYIDFSVNLMTDAGPKGNSYGSHGRTSDTQKRCFIDMKL